jgi:hypothetical protein
MPVRRVSRAGDEDYYVLRSKGEGLNIEIRRGGKLGIRSTKLATGRVRPIRHRTDSLRRTGGQIRMTERRKIRNPKQIQIIEIRNKTLLWSFSSISL